METVFHSRFVLYSNSLKIIRRLKNMSITHTWPKSYYSHLVAITSLNSLYAAKVAMRGVHCNNRKHMRSRARETLTNYTEFKIQYSSHILRLARVHQVHTICTWYAVMGCVPRCAQPHCIHKTFIFKHQTRCVFSLPKWMCAIYPRQLERIIRICHMYNVYHFHMSSIYIYNGGVNICKG